MKAYLHNGKWYLYKPRIRIPLWFAKRISKYGYFTDAVNDLKASKGGEVNDEQAEGYQRH